MTQLLESKDRVIKQIKQEVDSITSERGSSKSDFQQFKKDMTVEVNLTIDDWKRQFQDDKARVVNLLEKSETIIG